MGQVSSGTLFGDVSDPSSAVISGVKVTARNEATGFERSTVSSGTGGYRIPDLAPGNYTVTVERSGFRTASAEHVVVEVNQKARLDIRLEVGTEHDTVTVQAEVSTLQSSDASEGYLVSGAVARQLPINGRNVVSLATLGPGATPKHLTGFVHDLITDTQQARGAVALNFPVNGARSTMNSFVLDGAYNTNRNAYAIAVVPPMDSVQEFRIQTSLGSAEFAQSGGAFVDMITKSGSRAFHGSAFEFLRNEATDARNYFDSPSQPRPIFRQNQFGGSLGGPLPFPSTYFFANYETLRGKSAKSTARLVPTAALRAGDFRGRGTIIDPLNGQPFVNNVIPSNRIDPIAARFLDKYEPLPNTSGSLNYVDSTPNQSTTHWGSMRIDRQFGRRNWLFARYNINDDDLLMAGNFPERPTSERLRAQQAAFGHTTTGANWLNELRASYTRLRVFNLPTSAFGPVDVLQDLGITSTPNDPLTYGLPYFVVNGWDTVTDNTLAPQSQRDNQWQIADGVTLSRGRHTVKIGGQWVHFQLNYFQSQFVRGRYIFNGAFTRGDSLADFLLGYAQETRRITGAPQAYLRQNSSAAYVQDEWRLNSRFAVTLGIRYEYIAPYTEARGRLLNLDYSTLPRAPRLLSVDRANEPDRNNFAPRVGLAWRLPKLFGRETVFRAGYGVYHTPEISREAYDLVRNNLRIEVNQVTGTTPVLTLKTGFPTNSAAGFPSYFGLDPQARTPYMQQWSGSFQHELGRGSQVEVSYVGSKGTKLGRFRTFNTPLHVETGENLAPRPGVLQELRTFPQLGPLIQRQHISNSNYHSLQLKGEKRFTGGLSLLTSFVWAKSIDDADTIIPGLGESFGAQDERNLRLERGLSVFNIGRRLSAGFVYNLPAAAFARPVLSNWSLSGIFTAQDGTRFNPVYFGTDFANSGTPNRPNVVPGQDVNLPKSQRSVEQWFNRAAFSNPAPFTFGNAGRNILPSPGPVLADVALMRTFRIQERASLQFRAEGFNIVNHPNWGVPGEYPDFGPFFGRIFTVGDPRRFQFGLRLDF